MNIAAVKQAPPKAAKPKRRLLEGHMGVIPHVRGGEPVQRAVEAVIRARPELETLGNPTGGNFYQSLAERLGGDQATSVALREAGIPGVKHHARLMGGANNYVIWNEAAMPREMRLCRIERGPCF